MAEVTNVTLQIVPGTTNTKRKVTVGYKLAFDATEAGKKFKLVISLFGEDKPGDDETPPLTLGGPSPIYTFSFGVAPPTKKFKTVTAQAGEQTFSEVREVNRDTLNEDPGFTQGPKPDINTPGLKIPHTDEVYAQVSIASEARSTTKPVP